MAEDDTNNDAEGGTIANPGSGNSNDVAELRRQLADVRARLRDVNAESRGHRLQADNFKTEAADLRTRLEAAFADKNTAIDTLKSEHTAALDALRGELTGQLETTRTELTGKLTEAEQAAADKAAKAKARSMMADLKVAAKDAGMVDLDGLKLLSTDDLKVSDEGDVENAVEVLAKLKEAKPYLFGNQQNTSNPNPPPKPQPTGDKKGMEMTAEEWAAKSRELQMGRV
jgi:hypothetical protein